MTDIEGISRVGTLDGIIANNHNPGIPRQVDPSQEAFTVRETMKRLWESAKAAFEPEERLVGILKQEDLFL